MDNAYLGAILMSVFRLLGGVLGPFLLKCGLGKRNILATTSLLMG